MSAATGRSATTTLVFYDGVCGLCDRFVRFLLPRDRNAQLRFAPLQGQAARRELLPHGIDPGDLDSVVVIGRWQTHEEHVLTRSRAVLFATSRLGGIWTVLAALGRVVPVPLADVMYGAVARRRYRLFGRFESCPLPRPEWRDRFLD